MPVTQAPMNREAALYDAIIEVIFVSDLMFLDHYKYMNFMYFDHCCLYKSDCRS